jgi:hypothetical protein
MKFLNKFRRRLGPPCICEYSASVAKATTFGNNFLPISVGPIHE